MSEKSTLVTTLKNIRNHLPYIGKLVKQRDHLLTKVLELENKTTDPLISQFVSFQRKQINSPRASPGNVIIIS